ncbi:CMRF35-like molecule 5 [Varanus komodoensis]|uniref:CMRF35-like molecule 5 n=1 Tax=Varanus komodoensis TaxID=61221 RepID=UPI001CF79373|nr:CMRF35-like molecule 5 [Varanus komodoensis]
MGSRVVPGMAGCSFSPTPPPCRYGFTAFLRSEKEESAIEGKSTTVRCTYDINRYRFSKKYWCRGSSRTSCDVLGDTEKFVKWNYKNKLSLWDFRRGIFVVTMKQLTTDDSGTYWCGIDRPFADIMIAVELKVQKAPATQRNMRTTPTHTLSSRTETTTTFPVISKSSLNGLLCSNSTWHHNSVILGLTSSPWGILRWVILAILVASFIAIHSNTTQKNWDVINGMNELNASEEQQEISEDFYEILGM